jgi:AraC-like DNA-binding protein
VPRVRRFPRTLPISVIWPFQRGFAQLGVSREAWLASWERLGYPLDKLSDPSTRLSLDRTLAELQKYVDLLGRADLGLLAAAATEPGDYGVIELAARAHETALEGLQSLAHDFALFAEGLHLAIEPRADVVTARLSSDPDVVLPPVVVEYVLLGLVRFVRHYRPGGCAPLGVRFAHARVAHGDMLEAHFGCRVEPEACEHAVDFARAELASSLSTSDPMTREILRAHVRALGAAAATRSLVDRLEALVAERIAKGIPALAELARDLGVSRRSLSRSLNAQNVRYRDICIRVRHRLAMHFLERTTRSIKEIAAATGYGDLSAFHRAFKQMTGSTPKQWRRARTARRGQPS